MSDQSSSSGSKSPITIALIIGVVGAAVGLFGVFQGYTDGESRNLFSWLLGLAFWMSIAIGMLFMILLFYIFKASWPIIIRRQLEHGMVAFPVLAVLFLPLVFIAHSNEDMPSAHHHGEHHDDETHAHPDLEQAKDGAHGDSADAGKHGDAHDDHGHGGVSKKSGLIWKWMALDGTDHHDVLLESKEAYLNKGAFTLRFFLYFSVFCGLGLFFRHASISQDIDGSANWTHLSIKVACGGIVAMALATTFAAIDWYKAIEHHWFSTMYGVWYFAASMRAALATTVIILFVLSTRGNLKGLFNQAHRYELGVLMFAFTIFWTYISFSQFFLIYNADIPEETFWYNIRQFDPANPDIKNSWYPIGMCLIFCNFLFPFFYLLFYRSKIVTKRILFIAGWILFWQIADIYYNILPGIEPDDNALEGAFDYTVRQFSVTGFDVASFIGIGGLCAAAFLWSRTRSEPIPIHDPRILDAIHHHE
ncbi:MAG: hypothetical protein CMO33_02250 [Verrucomicrobia bacterium]|nr:hypothetical protein [Verrucomicrobiota bacterium]